MHIYVKDTTIKIPANLLRAKIPLQSKTDKANINLSI